MASSRFPASVTFTVKEYPESAHEDIDNAMASKINNNRCFIIVISVSIYLASLIFTLTFILPPASAEVGTSSFSIIGPEGTPEITNESEPAKTP